MRYQVTVHRTQIAERNVRAISEEDAIKQIEAELERPYGSLGGWKTINTGIDVTEVTSSLHEAPRALNQEERLLLSIKEAAQHLGISYGALYELVNTAEIEHIAIGRRKYISRDHLKTFIESHTRVGWHGSAS